MPMFETIGSSDPLGLWEPAPQPGMVHFGSGDEAASPPPNGPVFRVNLPGRGERAVEAFEASKTRFEQVDAVLGDIPDQLDNLVSQMQARQAAGESVSFDITSPAEKPDPKSVLLNLLNDVSQTQTVSFSAGEQAEPIREPVSRAWQEARASFQDFMEQINREVLHFIWVETTLAGQLVARSQVDWSGDAITLWDEPVSEEQRNLHLRSLEIAARSRNMKLRLFVTVVSGVAKITALMTAGTPILALPAIYQYVMAIVNQNKQMQSIL